MGRQSSRIYYKGLDHKEMVIWDGNQYVYHDKAYIWTGSEFELVWQKLFGFKLLYETELTIKPVSSENNLYLYFTEGGDDSVIYRIVINDEEPEKEERYTSDTYTIFTAPTSSRGIGIHATPSDSNEYSYAILNLENGTISETDTFNTQEEFPYAMLGVNPPTLVDQQASPAHPPETHTFQSIVSSYAWGQSYTPHNFIYFVAKTGISAMELDNREGSGLINPPRIFDIGRINDSEGDPRSLLPRFLTINSDDSISILEYGSGEQYGYYSATVHSQLPFSLIHHTAGGGLVDAAIKVTRDHKLPVLGTDNHIWIIQANDNDFTFTDTEIESEVVQFDVDPTYKYAIINEEWNHSTGTVYPKIVELDTGKTVVELKDEIGDLQFTNSFFVGAKCVFVEGYYQDSWTPKRRLYKWR